MRQRRWKYVVVMMIIIFAGIAGVRQTHFQTVDSYRQEQKQLAGDVFDGIQSPEGELGSMYATIAPSDSEKTEGSSGQEKSGKASVQDTENGNTDKKTSKDPEISAGTLENNGTEAGSKAAKDGKNSRHRGSSRSKSDALNGKSSTSVGKGEKPKKPGKASTASDQSSQSGKDKKTDTQPSGQNVPAADPSSGQETGQQNTADNNTKKPDAAENNSTDTSSADHSSSGGKAEDAAGNSGSSGSTATVKPEEAKITCTLEIRCDSLVQNKKQAQESIWKYIPSNGKILDTVSVKVDKGASVYDVLEKACKAKGVALDADYTPAYKSYYVRGIGHIYEKQAGSMSGWIYKVNGTAPNKGASAYKVSEGDVISWKYTCDGRST
mgnify:FL=1